MSKKRDILGELDDLRDRATGVDDLDNGILKLRFLLALANRAEDEGEQTRYFIVASIAALETYFRWQIKTLIDSGDHRFLNNVRLDEVSLKIDHELAIALHGRRVTVGELVAHSVGLSSFEQISGIMTKLLSADFVSLVKEARNARLRREQGKSAPPVLLDPGTVISNVKRAFELRHIICHEVHFDRAVKLAEIKELCRSCYAFAQASYSGIAFYQHPDAPLTFDEASEIAGAREASLKDELKALVVKFAEKLTPLERDAFMSMQESWAAYADREADFFYSVRMNGNRGVYDEIAARVRLYRERIEQLGGWMEGARWPEES